MKDGIPGSKAGIGKTKYCVWYDAHNTENFHGKREGNNMWDALIDYLFISFAEPECATEANVDGDPSQSVDLSDLTALIDYLFISFTPPAECL